MIVKRSWLAAASIHWQILVHTRDILATKARRRLFRRLLRERRTQPNRKIGPADVAAPRRRIRFGRGDRKCPGTCGWSRSERGQNGEPGDSDHARPLASPATSFLRSPRHASATWRRLVRTLYRAGRATSSAGAPALRSDASWPWHESEASRDVYNDARVEKVGALGSISKCVLN